MFDPFNEPMNDELFSYSVLVNIIENASLPNVPKSQKTNLNSKIIRSFMNCVKYKSINNMKTAEKLLHQLFNLNIFDTCMISTLNQLSIINSIFDEIKECSTDNLIHLTILFKTILIALEYAQETNYSIDWIDKIINRDNQLEITLIRKVMSMKQQTSNDTFNSMVHYLFDLLMIINQSKKINWSRIQIPFASFLLENITPIDSLVLPQTDSYNLSSIDSNARDTTVFLHSLDNLDSETKLLRCAMESLVNDGINDAEAAQLPHGLTQRALKAQQIVFVGKEKTPLLCELCTAESFNFLCDHFLQLLGFHQSILMKISTCSAVIGKKSTAIYGDTREKTACDIMGFDLQSIDTLLMDTTVILTQLITVVDVHIGCNEMKIFMPKLRQVCYDHFLMLSESDNTIELSMNEHNMEQQKCSLQIQCALARMSPLLFFGPNEFTITDFILLTSYLSSLRIYATDISQDCHGHDQDRQSSLESKCSVLLQSVEDIFTQMVDFSDRYDLSLLEHLLANIRQPTSVLLIFSVARLLLHLLIRRQDTDASRMMYGDAGQGILTGLRRRTYLDDQPAICTAAVNLLSVIFPFCSEFISAPTMNATFQTDITENFIVNTNTVLYLVMICYRCGLFRGEKKCKVIVENASIELDRLVQKQESRKLYEERILLLLRILLLSAVNKWENKNAISGLYEASVALTTHAKLHKEIIRSVLWYLVDPTRNQSLSIGSSSVKTHSYYDDILLCYSQYLLLIVSEANTSSVSDIRKANIFLDSDSTDSIRETVDFITKYIKNQLEKAIQISDIDSSIDTDDIFFDPPTDTKKMKYSSIDTQESKGKSLKGSSGVSDNSSACYAQMQEAISEYLLDACWKIDQYEYKAIEEAGSAMNAADKMNSLRQRRGLMLLILASIRPEYAILFLVTAPFYSDYSLAEQYYMQTDVAKYSTEFLARLSESTIRFSIDPAAVEVASAMIVANSNYKMSEMVCALFPVALVSYTDSNFHPIFHQSHISVHVGPSTFLLNNLIRCQEKDHLSDASNDQYIVIIPNNSEEFSRYLDTWCRLNHRIEVLFMLCYSALVAASKWLEADVGEIDEGIANTLLYVSGEATSHLERQNETKKAKELGIQVQSSGIANCIDNCIRIYIGMLKQSDSETKSSNMNSSDNNSKRGTKRIIISNTSKEPTTSQLDIIHLIMKSLSNLVEIYIHCVQQGGNRNAQDFSYGCCQKLVKFVDEQLRSEATMTLMESEMLLSDMQILVHKIAILLFNHRQHLNNSKDPVRIKW